MERTIKFLDHFIPFDLAICNLVKLLFYGSRKMKVHDLWKIVNQEIIHQRTNICWEKFILFSTGILGSLFFRHFAFLNGIHLVISRCTFTLLLYYILSFLNSTNGWRIG